LVTIEEIRKIAQPPEKMREEIKDYPFISPLFRRVSPYFTKFFVEHNVTANQVTALSILFAIAGDLLFVFGDYYLMLIGCVFCLFWQLLDFVDGEIARVTNLKTIGGLYLENVHHSFDSCFFAFFGIGLYKMLGNMAFAYFGFTITLFLCLGKCFMFSREIARKEGIKKEKRYAKYVNPLRKKRSLIGTIYRSIYIKIRYLFHFSYIYPILTCILVFELLSPIKSICVIYGIPLTVLSAYFFFCGFGWIFRVSIGGITNYVYLMKG
jgi:phosphatidylglycerophosphate synthase